jgi:putative ubiquitin-RnfH superfamily antitoxin RatB of RatAB toxin-antitoxin module
VEIYRPLLADPKEVRKARAARAKERRAAGKSG